MKHKYYIKTNRKNEYVIQASPPICLSRKSRLQLPEQTRSCSGEVVQKPALLALHHIQGKDVALVVPCL